MNKDLSLLLLLIPCLIFLDVHVLPKIKVTKPIKQGRTELGKHYSAYSIITNDGKKFSVNENDYAFILGNDSLLLTNTRLFKKTLRVEFVKNRIYVSAKAGVMRGGFITVVERVIGILLSVSFILKRVKRFDYQRKNLYWFALAAAIIEGLCYALMI